jgi:hypothetical protein
LRVLKKANLETSYLPSRISSQKQAWQAIVKNETKFAMLSAALEEQRSLRPYIEGDSDFFALTAIDTNESTWAAYQVLRRPDGAGFLMAFRRCRAGEATRTFQLVGLEPWQNYTLFYRHGYRVDRTETVLGHSLTEFAVTLPSPSSSVLIMIAPVVGAPGSRPVRSKLDDESAKVAATGGGADSLWPLPESVQCTAGGLPLAAGFKVHTSAPSAVAIAAAQRYTELFAPAPLALEATTAAAGARTLSGVVLVIQNASEALGVDTRYDYTLRSTGSELTATASSPYGAVAALETIGQLLSGCKAGFGCTHFTCAELLLSDSPMFRHRGLMIDAGRRHYPLPLVKDLLEGMAMARLNVLHLHFADYGNSEFEQFGAGGIRIESKRYPQLTAGLEDSAGNRLYYTQEEVGELVAFAKLRGIRVLPELEQTGHASYLWSLAGPPHDLEFCSTNTEDKTGAQVYNDVAGRAKAVLTSLVEEYSALFPDAVFHTGSDETAYVGNCTKQNTIDLEREVAAKVVSLAKKPMLWWANATTLQVARPGQTIINAWTPSYSAVQATAAGYEAVESAGGQFYLDHPKGKGWADLSPYWFDITRAETLTARQREILLGGEVSMWNNPWCLWGECHSTKGERFCGWWMSGMDAKYDAEYARSVQGAVWPKAAVAAGAFYRYNSSLPVEELTRRVRAFTAAMTKRGLRPCTCSAFDGVGGGCTPAARCGVPYANSNSSGAPVDTCKSDDIEAITVEATAVAAAAAKSGLALPRQHWKADHPGGGGGNGDLVLVQGGKPVAEIWLPHDDSSNNSRVAAEELQLHVRLLTGATLPVHLEADPAAAAGQPARPVLHQRRAENTSIWIGNSSHTQQHLSVADQAVIGGEGFKNIVKGSSLYLFGDDACNQSYPNDPLSRCRQGTVFAVEVFLRDQLGIRWLWPGDSGTFVPPCPDKSASVARALNVSAAPALLNRATGNPWKPTGWCKEYYAQHAWLTGYNDAVCLQHHAENQLWKRRMLAGAHDMPMTGEGYGSALWKAGSLDNMTGWKQKHSEYFALLPSGQRGPVVDHTTHRPSLCPGPRCGQYVHMCVSDHNLHVRIVNDSLPAIAAGKATGISAVDDDGGVGFCTCSKCRALDVPRLPASWDGSCTDPSAGPPDSSRLSDRYAFYANQIYDELQRRLPGREDLWVTTYAYECYHAPPRRIKFPARTMTWLCSFNSYPRAANTTAIDRSHWKAWVEAGASVVLRPNSLYYLGYGMPFDATAQFVADIGFCGQHGMVGADFDTMLGNHATVGPLYYVLSRQLWDPKAADVAALTAEYYSGFGGAAQAVRRYWEYWEVVTLQRASPAAMVTMAAYSGLKHDMTYSSAAYNETAFGTASALLGAAEATAATAADKGRVALLQSGLQHGLLTWRAYYATLNSTVCPGVEDPDTACDEGYVGGGLDKGGGYAEACTCEVSALLAAARALQAYRASIATSQAVNVYWTSWAEMDAGKAQDCNPCFGGYTGAHLAKFAGGLNASVALSVAPAGLICPC